MFTVFVHAKEDTMWVLMLESPKSISSSELAITLQPKIVSYEAKMTEKMIVSLDKESSRCKNYPEKTGYDECSQMFFFDYFGRGTNCTIPGMLIAYCIVGIPNAVILMCYNLQWSL